MALPTGGHWLKLSLAAGLFSASLWAMNSLPLYCLGIALLTSCSPTVEKPDYKVLQKDGKYELRKYPDLAVVSAPMGAMDQRNTSFRSLFRYISGENEKQQKISMTSPVFMDEGNADAKAKGAMSFVMPKKVVQAGAPEPSEKQVALGKISGGTFAIIDFKGWRSKAKQQAAEKDLIAWVKAKGWKSQGSTFFAFYNPPWTPELLRQNEVWLKVETPD